MPWTDLVFTRGGVYPLYSYFTTGVGGPDFGLNLDVSARVGRLVGFSTLGAV